MAKLQRFMQILATVNSRNHPDPHHVFETTYEIADAGIL